MCEIIVALDGMKLWNAVKLAEKLDGQVWGFKFNDLLTSFGTSIIRRFKKYGKVFADPKLHDTPETVANCVRRLSKAGADIITVHAAGGKTMLKEALGAAGSAKIAAVTALTSMSSNDLSEVYKTQHVAYHMATVAVKAGIAGLVCSGADSKPFRYYFNNCFLVVPGIRPWPIEGKDFQQRVTKKEVSADFLVVGRPITTSSDPLLAVNKIKDIFG